MPTQKSKRRLPKIIALAATGLALAGLVYYFKTQFIVTWVNGRPIWHSAYIHELENLAKTQALNSLVTKRLILDEAAKQKVTVSDDEINTAIQSIEEKAKAQGTTLDELMTAQGLNRQAVREEVKLQKLLEKLAGDVSVSDEQVQQYWDKNKDTLYAKKKLDDVKDEIKDQLKQQGLISQIQDLISKLQSQAKIVKWLQ